MKQMNLIYETETESDREQTVVAKVEEGAADWEFANSRQLHIEGINKRSYCTAQATIFNILQ